jgi:hypothetical protein
MGVTINGEDIVLIVPRALAEPMRILAGLLASDKTSAVLPVLLADVYPWARHLPLEAVEEFGSDLRTALRAGADAPERMEQAVMSWRATAEAYADPDLLAELRTPVSDCGPVPEPAAT